MSVFPGPLDAASARSVDVRRRQRELLGPLLQNGYRALPALLEQRAELGPMMVFRVLERMPRFGRQRLIDINVKCMRGVDVDGVLVIVNLFRPVSEISDRQCTALIKLLVPTPEEEHVADMARARRRRRLTRTA